MTLPVGSVLTLLLYIAAKRRVTISTSATKRDFLLTEAEPSSLQSLKAGQR